MRLKILCEDIGITCDNCVAACCRFHDRIHVKPTDKTPPEYCDNSDGLTPRISMKLVPDATYGGRRCICLDPKTNKCSIYDLRPSTCREFEMGGSQCQYIRKEINL